jgi:hypothetical protein
MKAVAAQNTTHTAPAKKQKTEARAKSASQVSAQPAPVFAGALIQRKCACGGDCPRCENEQKKKPHLQTKLKVSTPGDQYEQEADRVAEQVMRMAAPPVHSDTSQVRQSSGLSVQRKCARCEDDENLLQRKESHADAGSHASASQDVPQVMRDVLGSAGQPLDAATRDFMESRFEYDFGNVRVHSGAQAQAAARSVDALAFTVGRDVVFGAAQYSPHTTEGKRLLAHELTHVVQQGATGSKLHRKPRANLSMQNPESGHTQIARRAQPGIGHISQAHQATSSLLTIQRACLPAGIGTPAGCTTLPSVFLDGYPNATFKSEPDCDDFASGEETKMITAATALPATAEIEVHGFATTVGDVTFNQNLSCARALKANSVLTAPTPGGAGIAAARIKGIFSHGPTPGPAAARRNVILTPPRATPLPTTVPAAGASDFQIERVGKSTIKRIYFARNSFALDSRARSKILDLRITPPGGSIRLIGYASADEPASVAQDRAKEVEKALAAPPISSPKALGAPVETPITATSATGNAPATASRGDFTEVRSVEILVGAATPSTLDCAAVDPTDPEPDPAKKRKLHPPQQACPTMDPDTETAFKAAQPIAFDAMKRAEAAVTGAITSDNEKLIDRFFGNHDAATITALQTNLKNLKDHVDKLPSSTNCGSQCDTGGCEKKGVIAYNNGVDAASKMTLCVPMFKSLPFNDQVRNLIHESAHGTTPLGGPAKPSEGTKDVAYRHERMLFQLAPADRLRNSDSYALFALFLREIETTGIKTAVPGGIQTPATDSAPGFGTDEPALRLALAQLEKRLSWVETDFSQLYGEADKIKKGTQTWAASWAEELMRQSAKRFPLTAPRATPTLTDQTRLASILERYMRMRAAVKRNLSITRMASGEVKWPASGGTDMLASDKLEIGPDFFRASPGDQISLLLEALARSTKDVEPAFVPAYVSLAEWIHSQNK